MYLAFTPISGESYRRRFRSSLLRSPCQWRPSGANSLPCFVDTAQAALWASFCVRLCEMSTVHQIVKHRAERPQKPEGLLDFYAFRYTVTTRMTPALRCFIDFEEQSDKTVSTTGHNFWKERRAEADSNRGPLVLTSLTNALRLGQTCLLIVHLL